MLLEAEAENPEADGEGDEGREPEGMEAVFGRPDSTVAFADPHWEAVIEEVAIYLGEDQADPAAEGVCY